MRTIVAGLTLGAVCSLVVGMSTPKHYEYKVEYYPLAALYIDKKLNEQDKLGWELVSASSEHLYYFRRER